MNTTLSKQLLDDVREAYGSLESPNWSFKEKRYNKNPYGELIKFLAESRTIQETTDLNDDVSVVVFVGDYDGSNGVSVWLSLIGKYVCFSDADGVFLSQGDLTNDNRTGPILDRVMDEGVIVVEPDELAKEIQFGGELASLFKVLFSKCEAFSDN